MNGPAFLREHESKWPQTILKKPEIQDELIKVLHIQEISPEIRVVSDPIRVETWTRMLRGTAYALRFLAGASRPRGDLQVSELQQAEAALHIEAQREFRAERQLVITKRQNEISKKSELYGTSLFIDQSGVMRFRSRNTGPPYHLTCRLYTDITKTFSTKTHKPFRMRFVRNIR